jgi:hypothetical protein
MLDDLRFGWRVLRKNRGTTAVACISLALGIGASTDMFQRDPCGSARSFSLS